MAQLVPLKTAAREIGISYQFLYAASQAEVVQTVRFGTRIMMAQTEVDRIVQEGIPPFQARKSS